MVTQPKNKRSSAGRSAKQTPPEAGAAESRGMPKRVSSPKSSGNRGVAFEHRVQATRLLAMCLGMPCLGVPDGFSIIKLLFQGRREGHNTDDLVLTVAAPTGEIGTVRMQMKSELAPTAQNKVFEEAVGLAWLDFISPEFVRDLDLIVVVHDTRCGSRMTPAAEVARWAFSSSNAAGWYDRVHAAQFSNAANRTAYAAIKAAAELYHGGPITPDELHQFVVHLRFAQHDLDSDGTAEVMAQKQFLFQAGVPPEQLAGYWAHLVQVCVALNGDGGDVDLTSVARHIGTQLNELFQKDRMRRQQLAAPHVRVAAPTADGALLAFVPATSVMQAVAPAPSAAPPMDVDAAPATRASSPNKIVSRQLDAINELRKANRFTDSLEQLAVLEQDLAEFDDHQRALWYWLRGICRWHQKDDIAAAAADLVTAADLADDEDKIAAGRIQAYLLRGETQNAAAAADAALAKFPQSLAVWAAACNARMLLGQVFSAADIPAEHLDKTAAWQVIAASQERAGDLVGAFESARESLTKADVSFFSREGLLRYALQQASRDGLTLGFRMPDGPDRERLLEAIAAFADRPQTLWRVQSQTALEAAITHLGYALLLTGNAQEAAALIDEARSHGVTSASIHRVEIESLRDLGRSAELLDRFEPLLPQLGEDALVSYAQVAVEASDFGRVDAAVAQGASRIDTPGHERLQHTLRMVRWEGMLAQKEHEALLDELKAADITAESTSIPDLMFAVRAQRKSDGDTTLREALLDRIEELATATEDRSEAYMGAKVLFRSGRLAAAALIYARILPSSAFSELHTELLYAYLRTGQRAKARGMLQTLPAEWKKDRDARHMALELAQIAGDWAEVAALAEIEVALQPQEPTGWLLRILAAVNMDRPDVEELVGQVPEELTVSLQDVGRLASAEMRFGHVAKGMRRLYRARREHMGEVEAAALHLTAIFVAEKYLPESDTAPEVVGPGTAVVLQDINTGELRRVTFDPADVDRLPATEEFVPPDDPLARRLFGLRVDDTLPIEQSFSEPRIYRITELQSAYRRLVETSHATVHSSITPAKYLQTVTLPQLADGVPDLTPLRQKLERQDEAMAKILELYAQHPAPLGMIAKRLNRDVMDVVRGWPSTGPMFDIGRPTEEAVARLDSGKPCVLDVALLTELAQLDLLHLLAHLPGAMVSSSTYTAIAANLERESAMRRAGTMFVRDGQIGFHEKTEADLAGERKFLENMLAAIRTHCSVLPAYGPDTIDPSLDRFRQVLSTEEYANVLLCLERDAALLSLDVRIRAVAASHDVKSAGPQDLMRHMLMRGVLSPRDYSVAVLSLMMRRRTFVSLNEADLAFLMYQGNRWLTPGINALREYLVDPLLNFGTAAPVIVRFISGIYNAGNCDFGVALELTEYLVEALLRHPACPRDWALDVTRALQREMNLDDGMERQLLAEAVRRAKEPIGQKMRSVTVRATVVHGMVTPWLRTGPWIFRNEAPASTRKLTSVSGGLAPDVDSSGTSAHEPRPQTPEL